MDKSVPAQAAVILDAIRSIEAPAGYDVIFGNRQTALAKPVTQMTLREILAAQKIWSTKKWAAKFKSTKASSATGGYQFMRATLLGLIDELGLSLSQVLDADLQDRLGYHLLRRRGFDLWLDGTISDNEFMKRVAQEWASFPVAVVTPRKGKRTLQPGESYYAGDGLNKALISVAKVRAILKAARAASGSPDPVGAPSVPPPKGPIPVLPLPSPDKPKVQRPTWLAIAAIAIVSALVFAARYFLGDADDTVSDNVLRFSGGAGESVWGGIVLQIALSFVEPLVSAIATGVVGWIAFQWTNILKTDFDQKSSDQLHAALSRAVLTAIEVFGPKATKGKVLNFAANYVEQWNPGTVKKLNLDSDKLKQLAMSHLAMVNLDKPE